MTKDITQLFAAYERLFMKRVNALAEVWNGTLELLAVDRKNLFDHLSALQPEPMAEEVAIPTREPCVNGSLERE